jgi:hypothetical protein
MLTGSVGGPSVDDLAPDAVIAKPFTLDELTDTVRALVAAGR